jgi:Uma2 family endonuclease
MTVDDLLALPQDEWLYELVEGRLVRMPASGGAASRIAARLVIALGQFVEAGDLGAITGADGEYDLTQPGDAQETALAPDVAFVRADRVPASDSPEYQKAWRLAPDLVAEVVSPNQYRPEMAEKARRYLAAGVRLVWIIWPKYQQVEVWRPGDAQATTTLGVGDLLDGLDVLPGFIYPVGRLLG